jgi:hypothetical protein
MAYKLDIGTVVIVTAVYRRTMPEEFKGYNKHHNILVEQVNLCDGRRIPDIPTEPFNGVIVGHSFIPAGTVEYNQDEPADYRQTKRFPCYLVKEHQRAGRIHKVPVEAVYQLEMSPHELDIQYRQRYKWNAAWQQEREDYREWAYMTKCKECGRFRRVKTYTENEFELYPCTNYVHKKVHKHD